MTHDARIGKIWWLALAVGFGLSALWLRTGWADLAGGRLPDTDDLMRLQQVRDWLGGQAFADVSQHRMGADGSMHWSRLGDLGIAAWIVALRPFFGAANAELAALVLWPATVFALYLGASARLAARVCGRDHAGIAVVIAALAFPAITMFVPGRIDHHGLQIVLVVLLAEAVLRPPSAKAGAWAGLLTALTLAIGLETLPQCLVAMAALGVFWLRDGDRERQRLAAFGGVLGAATLGWVALTGAGDARWCDGFTPAAVGAILTAAGFWLALAAIPAATLRARLGSAAAAALVAAATLSQTSAVCLTGPYGPVDPLLQRLWLAQVEEARGLFAQTPAMAIAFGALPAVAAIGALVFLWRERLDAWALLLALLLAGLLVALFQARAAPLAAAFAAPVMAHVVSLARARGTLRLAVAWLSSAGLMWSSAAHALVPAPQTTGAATCLTPEMLARLAALPPGRVLAPIDLGPTIVARTHHHVLAAPYHRNNVGNRAAYDYWLAPPARAAVIAKRWRVNYVIACPDAFGAIDLAREAPGGMALRLSPGLHSL